MGFGYNFYDFVFRLDKEKFYMTLDYIGVNKNEIYVARLVQTFNKIMKRKPRLDLANKNSMDVFELAVQEKCSHLLEGYIEKMTKEEQEIFESYRLARLFE